MQTLRCHIRWIVSRDLPEVLAIDQEWTEFNFRENLRQVNCAGMVAEVGAQVVGFVLYLLREKEIFIVRLKVHGEWQRKKVGTAIIEKLKLKLSSFRRPLLATVIDDGQCLNDFLRSCGFRAAFVGRSGMVRMHFKIPQEEE
jgi:ribosomal-protein-alanine N-acetyltransferase